jgi:hypothetical protein
MLKRECGKCTLCCELPEIEVLHKPMFKKCDYQFEGGCKFYQSRPRVCRNFSCMWLSGILNFDKSPLATGIIVFYDENSVVFLQEKPSVDYLFHFFAKEIDMIIRAGKQVRIASRPPIALNQIRGNDFLQ